MGDEDKRDLGFRGDGAVTQAGSRSLSYAGFVPVPAAWVSCSWTGAFVNLFKSLAFSGSFSLYFCCFLQLLFKLASSLA